eukprot:CAMPEP_0175074050 /NCGR_PEP_ID=MMETSP0052_2-20121109/21011_1 /TAXON_ID=51329 ORGANISM="Polytomella parva, Strain SAG 63-3" /NCGR_SAMPLE_ID=MMETSP0052_2 /ASSEMBLY_ACC=CAM_ASM_000194 /LENGTH=269 /DNA_ID=CAMNT_0016342145 /DNA_START=95 /DNA_END=900 /DNA_ORIENTATION=+
MSRERKISKTHQFYALLRKNVILQTQNQKSFLGIGGWAGLVAQIVIPMMFFLLMYIPTYYIKPVEHKQQLTTAVVAIESRWWGGPIPYEGPAAKAKSQGRARIILTPDVPAVHDLSIVLAKALACPRDPKLRICPYITPNTFHCLFMPFKRPDQSILHGRMIREEINGDITKSCDSCNSFNLINSENEGDEAYNNRTQALNSRFGVTTGFFENESTLSLAERLQLARGKDGQDEEGLNLEGRSKWSGRSIRETKTMIPQEMSKEVSFPP